MYLRAATFCSSGVVTKTLRSQARHPPPLQRINKIRARTETKRTLFAFALFFNANMVLFEDVTSHGSLVLFDTFLLLVFSLTR